MGCAGDSEDGTSFFGDSLMNILYHLTIPPPKMPECEAISQEIHTLRRHFGGELIYLNPNLHSPIYLPRVMFGFHRLRYLRALEANLQLHHLYNPDPFPFPILRALHRPVIYSLTGGVRQQPKVPFFSSLAAVTVTDEDCLKRLKAWGISNAFLVYPGIDTDRFTHSPLPLQSEIRLMVGSAPWTEKQFRTKGVEALLLAAQQTPELRLIFLWRGILADEMEHRVRQMNLEKQVTVLNEKVNVNKVLAGVHASITLATTPIIVKSYPHSLLESLAAGKPVLVSRAIPMADYVNEKGCGQVVEKVTPADILAAVEALTNEYESAQKAAYQVGQRDFSQEEMLASFDKVYRHVLEQMH
jgi:glycosyltransferase involved in cell wall biosynthesis